MVLLWQGDYFVCPQAWDKFGGLGAIEAVVWSNFGAGD
jgi:hypothetical protein